MGNLVQILTARRLQLAGHTPYALVGGATGHDRRPEGLRRAHPQLPRHRQGVGGQGAHPDRALLVVRGANAATMVDNYDWTASLSTIDFLRDIGKHFPVNRMLASRDRAPPARVGHQLHRVQLRAAAVDGLPEPLPRPRRDAAARRLRPVGQHHRRRRAHPAGRRRPRPRVRHAPGHQGRRHQVRQDRGRRPVARPGDDVAVRLLPVLAQHRGLPGRGDAQDLHVPRAARRSRSWAARPRRSRSCGPARRPWPSRSPPSSTAPRRPRQVQAAAAALFGGGDLSGLSGARSAQRCARPASATVSGEIPSYVDLMVETGLAKSRGDARRTIAEGGAYLNNQRVEDPELVPSASRPRRRLVAGAAPREEDLRRRRGDPDLNSCGSRLRFPLVAAGAAGDKTSRSGLRPRVTHSLDHGTSSCAREPASRLDLTGRARERLIFENSTVCHLVDGLVCVP